MSNVLSDEKRQQVIALGRLGWPLRQIEQATGVRRETASRYLKAAGIVIRAPGGWGRRSAKAAIHPSREPEQSKPAIKVTTDFSGEKHSSEPTSSGSDPITKATSTPEQSKAAIEVTTDFCKGNETTLESKSAIAKPNNSVASRKTISNCEPYRDLIQQAVDRGRNAMAIWQDLVSQYGFQAGYQSVKRFVQKLRPSRVLEARPVIRTQPGEEAQVDYGTGPMVRHPQTGKHKRTRLFVMTLGYSRKSVRFLVFHSSSQVWAELHEKAFRRLGGSVRVIVLDNLREGVGTPDIYDPTLNPLYRDMLAHYGVVALPCRIKDPNRKGKVESGVGHAQKTPLKGMRFDTLEEAQEYLDKWESRWADTRIHGTTKRQVSAMFAEEKPALLPLPLQPFRSYRYGQRVVHLDGCVEVEAAFYSTPPGWIGRKVHVQWDGLNIRIIDPKTGQLLREHLRQKRGWHRINEADLSPRTPLSTTQLLRRADTAGGYIGALCERIHKRDGQVGVRRIQGVLSLAKKFGAAVVDDACAAALELGVYEYRFVRRYLERRPQLPLSLKQVNPLIRELVQYRDLIQQRTEEKKENECH